jgi:hypothetical protein
MKNNAKNKYLLASPFVILITSLFISCSNHSQRDFYYKGYHPPVKTITMTENGQNYSVEAVFGHVIVIFKPTVSHSRAIRDIKKIKGMIITQSPGIHYYVVYVGSGNEAGFIHKIKTHPGIRFVSLDIVEYPCAAAPQTSVIDNFNISHGNSVVYTLQECGLTTKINKYNVGLKDDKDGRMSLSEINGDLNSILKNAPSDTPVIINMSFGPAFTDPAVDFWTDENITDEVKNNYRKHYKEGLKNLVAIVSNYKEKDFVIVKSAGNNGLKSLDTEILNDLGKELSAEEFTVLNSHFILAGAEDSRDPKYSNAVSRGNYNFLYTAVDISDLKYNDSDLYGTSFAAPRLSCFLGTVVNEHNIKATEALKAVKDITYRTPGRVLSQNDLEQRAKTIAANKPAGQNTPAPSQAVNSGNDRKTSNEKVNPQRKTSSQPTSNSDIPDKSNHAGQTWGESDFYGIDYYTVITKSQFDAIIKESEKKYSYIGIYYSLPYLYNKLNIKAPYYLIHTREIFNSPFVDLSTFKLKYNVSLYYIGTNDLGPLDLGTRGGVHIMFADSIVFDDPYWFKTNSWSRKYLDLLIVKSNNTDKNIDKKIDKLYAQLYRRGQIVH